MRARAIQAGETVGDEDADEREGEGGKWALFLLPFVTVLREGLEAVLFVSGVSYLFTKMISQPTSAGDALENRRQRAFDIGG